MHHNDSIRLNRDSFSGPLTAPCECEYMALSQMAP